MIKRIKLINFKSHRNTEIEFSDGLTCLIGSGNVGKSAVISGIRWVTENNTAKDFISWGESSSAVSLLFDNGIEVIRERDGKTNAYKIIFPDGTEKEFKNFGTEIPREVQEVIPLVNLPIDIDKQINLNMIRQHDSLFLLGDKYSGSDRNKTINAIIGMQYIDSAIKSLSPEIKGSNSKKEKVESEIEEVKLKIESLGDIDQLELTINEVKQLCSKIEILNKKKEELFNIVQKSEDVQEKLDYIKYRKSELPSEGDIKELNRLIESYIRLVSVYNTVSEFQGRQEIFNKRKVKYDGVDIDAMSEYSINCNYYTELLPILQLAESFQERYDKFIERKKEFDKINISEINDYFTLVEKYKNLLVIEKNSDEINVKTKDISERKEYLNMERSVSYGELINRIKEIHTCPFCDSEVDDAKARIIVERI